MTDEELRALAISFAKRNKNAIARERTDLAIYAPDPRPISIFMAGSPGAGKTEYSQSLLTLIEKGKERRVVRIDSDDLRPLIPGYTGANSHLVQGAASLIVEKMHDRCLHYGQSFLFDGTLSKYDKALHNIQRSLQKDRPVFIFYIYQKPETAWKVVLARQEREGRNIPKEAFIEEFIGAREVVERIRDQYNDIVRLFLVKKDSEKNQVEYRVAITSDGKQIDDYISERYTKEVLQSLL